MHPSHRLMLPLVLTTGCVLTPDRFFEDLDREVAELIERCDGPSAANPDVEGPWTGDVLCPDYDVSAARSCLQATRAAREASCVDPVEQPGAYRLPSACDLAAICGPSVADVDSDGAEVG